MSPIIEFDANKAKGTTYSGLYSYSAQPWWMPTGVGKSDIIAAYQFVNADSEAKALTNLVDSATLQLYKLNSPTWSKSAGFSIPADPQAGLNNDSIGLYSTVAIRFSDVDLTTNNIVGLVGSNELTWLIAKGYQFTSQSNCTYYKVPSYSTYPFNSDTTMYKTNAGYTSGVFIYIPRYQTHNSSLYANGNLQSATSYSSGWTDYFYRVTIGQTYRKYLTNPAFGTINIQAVAFYNTELTVEQIQELTDQMANL